MLSIQEYLALKKKDMEYAQRVIKNLEDSKDYRVMYKTGRPIMDIKHMLETSCEIYAENTAFMVKAEKGGPYRNIKYKNVIKDVNSLGTALIDRGLKNQRIAMIGENSYKWSISYLATVCGTGIAVPLDKELNSEELKQLIIEAEISCIIFDDKYEKTFSEMKAGGGTNLEILISMDKSQSTEAVISLEELMLKGEELINLRDKRFIDAQIYRDEMSIILFTSGTTGIAKGVMLSHGNIVEDLMSTPTLLEVKATDVFFSVLPLHHTYECTCGFLMPLYKGAAIAYCEGLKYIVKNLSEAKPTIFLAVPLIFENLYRKIWQNAKKSGKDKLLRKMTAINRKTKKIGIDLGPLYLKQIRELFGGRMRTMICGGAAIDPNILYGLNDFGITALQGYGLTECAPICALNPDKFPKHDSAGYIPPGFDARIESPDQESGIGEICVKGGNVMLGYYNNPEATKEVLRDGWFYTGDLGFIDEDRYIHITGRKKNVIITKNGKNVYPEEIEYYLSKAPYILESFVWQGEGQTSGETLIVATIRTDKEELVEALGEKYSKEEEEALVWLEIDKINSGLPFFKRIKKISIREDEFEKTTAKKIKRFSSTNKN